MHLGGRVGWQATGPVSCVLSGECKQAVGKSEGYESCNLSVCKNIYLALRKRRFKNLLPNQLCNVPFLSDFN